MWQWKKYLIGVVVVGGMFGLAYLSVKHWEWLGLLITPLALALVAWWLSKRLPWDDQGAAERRLQLEREAADKRAEFDLHMAEVRAQYEQEAAAKRGEFDRQMAELRAQMERAMVTDRMQEAALQAYVDRMTELVLEKNLCQAGQEEEVVQIARSRTLTTLRSLDGVRKGRLVRFLVEAKLVDKERPVIQLRGADLSEAELTGANLEGAELDVADLRGAELVYANLAGADLTGADLTNADLTGVKLEGADLSAALLEATKLAESNLAAADLSGADLTGADLRGAINFTNEQAASAISLRNATMPDGKVFDPEIHTPVAKLKDMGLDKINQIPQVQAGEQSRPVEGN